ncbi:MAG TPA: YsnF/AvaK domain-containing protein [Nitrososphaeraceae archaeon]|nr:YsnF/AvaK domain-containing protein [Nitrososphaeraceae archaeon]
MESTDYGNILWEEVIKKEARGIDDYSLGEVRQVTSEYVITHKGIVNTKWFQIPKHLAQAFDGNQLVLKVTEKQAKDLYVKHESPLEEDQEDSETTVSLVEERLEPRTRQIMEEATIVKEPIKETKHMDVSLTHEELVLERRPLTEPQMTDQEPVESRTEIKIPLKREEIETTKQSYVKEEVIVTKKPITETQTITEELTSEKLTEG